MDQRFRLLFPPNRGILWDIIMFFYLEQILLLREVYEYAQVWIQLHVQKH